MLFRDQHMLLLLKMLWMLRMLWMSLRMLFRDKHMLLLMRMLRMRRMLWMSVENAIWLRTHANVTEDAGDAVIVC